MKAREFIASVSGNALEWFDYILYAYLTPLFAPLFFPAKNPLTSLMLSFSVFAGGFLIRPVGGMLIGYIGDKYSRRHALITTMSLMTIATSLMAMLPTYTSIGLAAPILLTVIRMLQGLATSGEFNSSANYLIEQSSTQHSFMGSLVSLSATFGIFMGALFSFLIKISFPPITRTQYGWRLAFAIAALFSFVLLIIRCKMTEKNIKNSKALSQWNILKELFQQHKKDFIKVILICSLLGIGNYYLFGFFNALLYQYTVISSSAISIINFSCIFISIFLIYGYGKLTEKFGATAIFFTGAIGFLLFAYPIFYLLLAKNIFLIFSAQLVFVNFLSCIAASFPIIIAGFFPKKIRNSGTAISYNLSLAIFGGTAPLLALSLIKYTHWIMAPSIYLSIVSLIVIFALIFFNAVIAHLGIERTGTPLQMALHSHDEAMFKILADQMDPAEVQRQ